MADLVRVHQMQRSAVFGGAVADAAADVVTLDGDSSLHSHDFVELVVVVGGAGTHRTQAGRQPLAAGDVAILRPGAWHGYERCDSLVVANCYLGTTLLRHQIGWLRAEPGLSSMLWPNPRSAQASGAVVGRIDADDLPPVVGELDTLAVDRAPTAMVVGRLLVLLARVEEALGRSGALPGPAPVHRHVTNAVRLLEDDPLRDWTVDDLARAVHLSGGYLNRLFADGVGMSPMAYLTQLRAERAAALLIETDDPVSVVGANAGWSDPSHFARRFRACFSMSPSAYRAAFRTRTDQLPTTGSREAAR